MKKLSLMIPLCIILFLSSCSLKQPDAKTNVKKTNEMPITNQNENIINAIKDFYKDRNNPILIYQQLPFEDGILVLADELTDGEHYPELHFIDKKGEVTYVTRGSFCWTLNFTQFKGYYIFFGLAAMETRQYGNNSIHIKKVLAKFPDRTESVSTGDKIIAYINPKQNDTRNHVNPGSYIMPVKGRNMPDNLVVVLDNGENFSISQKSIDFQDDQIPDYFNVKRVDIYNSYAFKFSFMLTPGEWKQGYIDGDICLAGKTDKNGNINALQLTPSGNMKYSDTSILPQDIRPFYMSYNSLNLANFSAGETVELIYPGQRKLTGCYIMKITAKVVEKEAQNSDFTKVLAGTKKIILPKEKGYYLFILQTSDKSEIQSYAGMFRLN